MPLAFSPKVMNGLLNVLGGPALPTQYLAVVLPPQSMFSWVNGTSIDRGFNAGAGPQADKLAGLGINAAGILRAISGAPLAMMVEKASIPGFQFLTKEIYRHGTHMKLPYARSHDTVKFTFICTNSMLERTFFDFWSTYIQAPKSHYMEYFSNFKSTIIIKKLMDSGLMATTLADPTGLGAGNTWRGIGTGALAEIGNTISVYELQEAYPVRIGSQELSYSDTQSFLTLDIEFEYTHIKSFVDKIIPEEMKGPHESIKFDKVQPNVEGSTDFGTRGSVEGVTEGASPNPPSGIQETDILGEVTNGGGPLIPDITPNVG